MKAVKLTVIVMALAFAAALAACSASAYSQEILENDTDGLYLNITAENASGNTATTEGALTVEKGDLIVISPNLTKGSIHVTITSSDGKTVAYDDDTTGRVLFSVMAVPGEYDVATTGIDGATGSMTIFSQNSDELAAMDSSLVEGLEQNGVDLNSTP